MNCKGYVMKNITQHLATDNAANDQCMLSDFEQSMELIHHLYESNASIGVPKPPIKYPVFQGGGAKGAVYIGVYEALDQQGLLEDIVCPGGASAGGIPAFFMSLGFNSEQFTYLSENLSFTDFVELKKNGWGEYFSGHKIGSVIDVLRYGAASPGKAFHHWASYFVEQVLGDRNATFRDLHEKIVTDPTLKDLLLTATHYGSAHSARAMQVFSYETTPDVVIADAFRATISFPAAFEPWEVHQREYVTDINSGESTARYTSLGFFADGGILNNLPIDCFNSQHYADAHYLANERHDEHGKPIQVNPCSVAFSLTTLDELKDEITPLPASIKTRQLEKMGGRTQHAANNPYHSWHLFDLAKAVFWNKIGKPEVEDIAAKHQLYFDQTVQLYPENISTLEFDVSKEKLAPVIDNGIMATRLWLNKFRDAATSYEYEVNFDDRPTKQDKIQKHHDPKTFYFNKLTELFTAFQKEKSRQAKMQHITTPTLAGNVRLQYLAKKIVQMRSNAENIAIGLTKEAFVHAANLSQERAKLAAHKQAKRWDIINPENIINTICDKLRTQPTNALQLLKSQLSNMLPLLEQEQGRLLHAFIKTNDVAFVDKTLRMITKGLKQSYYHSKIKNPNERLIALLNHAKPSLIKTALEHNNLEMIDVLIKHGAYFAISDAIALGHYEGFKHMVNQLVDEETPMESLTFGQIPLWECVMKQAPQHFIKQLCEDSIMLEQMVNANVDASGKSILHYLAEKGTPNGFASTVYHILASSSLPNALITAKDANGNSPLTYLINNERSDVLHRLIEKGKGQYCGLIYTTDYHFDEIFNWKNPGMAHTDDYQDLFTAFHHHTKIFELLMNHFSDQGKADAIAGRIAREANFIMPNQPVLVVLDLSSISQEPILFSQQCKLPKQASSSHESNKVLTLRRSLIAA